MAAILLEGRRLSRSFDQLPHHPTLRDRLSREPTVSKVAIASAWRSAATRCAPVHATASFGGRWRAAGLPAPCLGPATRGLVDRQQR